MTSNKNISISVVAFALAQSLVESSFVSVLGSLALLRKVSLRWTLLEQVSDSQRR